MSNPTTTTAVRTAPRKPSAHPSRPSGPKPASLPRKLSPLPSVTSEDAQSISGDSHGLERELGSSGGLTSVKELTRSLLQKKRPMPRLSSPVAAKSSGRINEEIGLPPRGFSFSASTATESSVAGLPSQRGTAASPEDSVLRCSGVNNNNNSPASRSRGDEDRVDGERQLASPPRSGDCRDPSSCPTAQSERSAPFSLRSPEDSLHGVGNDDSCMEGRRGPKQVIVSEEVLKDWTGWEDLHLVLTTELRVDAEGMMGVDQIGRLLPQIVSLKMNRSRIPKMRLLGTQLHHVKYLWLNNSQVQDLRGIGSCTPVLQELYLAFNHVEDVTPLLDLSGSLQVLDLEGNALADAPTLQFVLSRLDHVVTLSLQGNPIERSNEVTEQLKELKAAEHDNDQIDASAAEPEGPTSEYDATTSHYPTSFRRVLAMREWVSLLMPNLVTLDDIPIHGDQELEDSQGIHSMRDEDSTHEMPPRAPSAMDDHRESLRSLLQSAYIDPTDSALAEELRLVQECIRDCGYDDVLTDAVEKQTRPLYQRPSTSCSGARPRLNPSFSSSRPSTGQVQANVRGHSESGLTVGGVLAGNAVAGLRKRLTSSGAGHSSSVASSIGATEGSNGAPMGATTHGSRNGTETRTPATRGDLLFTSDDDEDEWDRFRAQQRKQRATAAGGEAEDGEGKPYYRQLYHQLHLDEEDAELGKPQSRPPGWFQVDSTAERPVTRGKHRENHNFDNVLLKEVKHTKAQIARAGKQDANPIAAPTAKDVEAARRRSFFEVNDDGFVDNRDQFEVIDLAGIPEEQF